MIERINSKTKDIAEKIYNVFQAAYKVEAELLNVNDFPPLNRTIDDFLVSENSFYAFWKLDKLAAVIELKSTETNSHIQSMVVHPDYFRQGIAARLVGFVLEHVDSDSFSVATGVENVPACALYKKFGFEEIRQWDTPIGVRKVRFELQVERKEEE